MKHLAFALTFLISTIAPALAGTTGILSGVATDEFGRPVPGAVVRVFSRASGVVTVHSDATGHFSFLSLAPDIYEITLEKANLVPVSYAGIGVFADQTIFLSFAMPHQLMHPCGLTVIDHGSLVKISVGGDVYSVYPDEFSGYPNPIAMMLRSIPGINLGGGGFSP